MARHFYHQRPDQLIHEPPQPFARLWAALSRTRLPHTKLVWVGAPGPRSHQPFLYIPALVSVHGKIFAVDFGNWRFKSRQDRLAAAKKKGFIPITLYTYEREQKMYDRIMLAVSAYRPSQPTQIIRHKITPEDWQ